VWQSVKRKRNQKQKTEKSEDKKEAKNKGIKGK